MVRLKAPSVQRKVSIPPKFQFQSGAVKSVWKAQSATDGPIFQFQSGAVKRQSPHQSVAFQSVFQFQSGAVKRHKNTRQL